MKTKFTLTFFLISCVLTSTVSLAQITITSADVSATYAVGSVMNYNIDSLTTEVNIGSPGATTWDFSNLKSHWNFKSASLNPASTPYFSDFPTSNVVSTFSDSINTFAATGWNYITLNSNSELTNGMVIKGVDGVDIILIKESNSPAQLNMKFPFTYNSQWSKEYISTRTMYYNESSINSTENHSESAVVDAYGSMIMPGGIVKNALRIKIDDRYVSSNISHRSISYTFIAKDGSNVVFSAKDTTHISSGIIQIKDATWIMKGSTVGINDQSQAGVSLGQNYPNPFYTSTRIKYSIHNQSPVKIIVYDFLGREVTTLLNEEKSPGSYEVEVDGSQLQAGIYFYKIYTDNYTETKKMTLSK